MRILLTNNTLAHRAGSELYLLDVATALRDRGDLPVAYSTVLGPIADDLRGAGVPVTDDLATLGAPPDVIHGHHHVETMTALLRFPGVPALYVYHGRPWEEHPPHFPRIRRHVAVSRNLRDRLVLEHGVPPERVRFLRSFVDLDRFRPRAPLPARPARALAFANYVTPDIAAVLREGCARAGLALDVAGEGVGNPCARPEALLGGYDVVLAMGRSGLEALAAGCAVVVCGFDRVGPMVTAAELERLRDENLGPAIARLPLSAEAVASQVARYDPADAAEVTRRVRATAGRAAAVETLRGLYDEVLAEQRTADPTGGVDEDQIAASAYLRWLGARVKAYYDLAAERERLHADRAALRAALDAAGAERDAARAAGDRVAAERARLEAEGAALRGEIAALHGSVTQRLRRALVQVPGASGLARWVAARLPGRLPR